MKNGEQNYSQIMIKYKNTFSCLIAQLYLWFVLYVYVYIDGA